MSNCYLCAAPNASKPLALKDTFTSHNAARYPNSKYLCDRCAWCIPLRAFYWNETKGRYSAIYSRNWSWLLNSDNSYPKFGVTITEGKDTLQVVTGLPTRVQMREWLLNPPKPPFTICIAESGQKHILPWALEATSRDYFPVQFELDTLHIYRSTFIHLVNQYEQLMEMGFSKAEISSGNYRSDRLAKNIDKYGAHEAVIATKRGSRLIELVSFVAQSSGSQPSMAGAVA
jgi:hypothetical protein